MACTAAATTSSTTAISTRAIRSPVTRPNPNYLRITQYETEGHAWYSALLMSLERARRQWPRVRRVVYARQGDSRRRRVPVPGAGSAQSGGREVAGQQQSHASGRRPHELDRCPGGFQLAGILQYRSGSPWNVTTGRDNNRDTEQNDRPGSRHSRRRPVRSQHLLRRLHRPRRQPRAQRQHRAVVRHARRAPSKVFDDAAPEVRGVHRGVQRDQQGQLREPARATCGRRCSGPRRRFRAISGRSSSASASISKRGSRMTQGCPLAWRDHQVIVRSTSASAAALRNSCASSRGSGGAAAPPWRSRSRRPRAAPKPVWPSTVT